MEHIWSDVYGARMHAATIGAGEPVVLVHGWGVSGRYMLPLAWALAPRFSVFVPDLPGHGRSHRSRVVPSIEAHADTLAQWLVTAGLKRPAIVANSMGCQIVTKLAVRRPERVGPMVLVGPTVDPVCRRARHLIFGALRDSAREPVRLVGRATQEGIAQGAGSLLAAARSALADRIEDRLPSIWQPTVVVLGDRDGVVSRPWAEQVTALLPRGSLVVVPGEPHAVHYTRPRLVEGIVAELLSEETEHAGGELPRNLPHWNVPAWKPNQPGSGQKTPPLFGYPYGYKPVPLAPHK